MKVFLGISLSKQNFKFIKLLLKSLLFLEIPKNYNLKIVFILEKKNFYIREVIKKFLFKKRKYIILYTEFSGIPESRNKFLKYAKKHVPKFIGFLDDDCVVNRKWLKNMIKFINKENCDIVGGPQLHKVKKSFYLDLFNLIEPNREHLEKVDWIATNNAFLRLKILKNKKIFFNKKLKNIGGSDQLFFKQLNKMNFVCRWNLKSKVTENIHINRENLKWFLKRNLRYGYSGNYIDKKIYGTITGSLLIILKIIYSTSVSLVLLLLFMKKNYLYKSIFFLMRSIGRILGLVNYTPKKYI